MKSLEDNISSCRHCSFYRSEGRRGGNCQKLGVPVQSSWSVCSLAVSPFSPSWQDLPGMVSWQGFALDSEINGVPLESELAIASENLNLENVICPES